MNKHKILITGSKGLIGTALQKQLISIFGNNIRGIDLRYPNNHPKHGDIRDPIKLKKLATNCVGIVHLAAVSRVIAGEKNPELCWDVNVNGTQMVLKTAQESPTKPWVIYASSREVYGQQATLPVRENVSLLPCNTYAQSKVSAEKLVLDYRAKGLQTAILRFSNVYGSTLDYADRVIPAFCRAAAFGKPIRIDGNHNTFDFTYIDDVIAGILKAIDKLQRGCFDFPPIHFTTGQATTLLEAAVLAKNLSRFELKFLEAPSRSFDVSTFYGDPTLAKDFLGWQPKISIQEGMARLVKMFETELLHSHVDEPI